MDVVQSLEARWYFPVESGTAVLLSDWFKQAPLENDGDRKDFYYVDPERPDLNAKARGGKQPKLEYKYRVGSIESLRLAPNIEGHVERWTKLSLPVDGGLSQYSRIIGVSKSRRQRKFAFDGQGVSEVSVTDKPAAGCGVEVTSIQATLGTKIQTACSFGLEAFGAQLSVEALFGVVRKLSGDRSDLQLPASASRNYSSWLIHSFFDNE